jgi:hypothetical protein
MCCAIGKESRASIPHGKWPQPTVSPPVSTHASPFTHTHSIHNTYPLTLSPSLLCPPERHNESQGPHTNTNTKSTSITLTKPTYGVVDAHLLPKEALQVSSDLTSSEEPFQNLLLQHRLVLCRLGRLRRVALALTGFLLKGAY